MYFLKTTAWAVMTACVSLMGNNAYSEPFYGNWPTPSPVLIENNLIKEVGANLQAPQEANATAIRPGDTVVVTSDESPLKVYSTVLAKLLKGQRCNVSKVQGNWIWTSVDRNQRRQKGWVSVCNVVDQSRYKQFLNAMLITRFSTTDPLGWNGFGLRSDGTVLVVNEWGANPRTCIGRGVATGGIGRTFFRRVHCIPIPKRPSNCRTRFM